MINMNRHTLVVILMLAISISLFAQITQPHRYEIEQKLSDDLFTIVPLEEDGLALFRETNDFNKGNRLWELIILDSTLNEKASTKLELDTRNDFIGYDYQPGGLSLLFQVGQHDKSPLTLILYNLDLSTNESFEIKPEIGLRLTHFVQVGRSFALGGYVSNDPAIVLYNTKDQSMLVVPGFFQKDMELVDVRANIDHKTFNTVLIDRSNRDDRKLIFRTFDLKGELILEDVIDVDENKVLINGIVSTLEREDIVIMGTWGGRSSKQASGIYAVAVNPFEKQPIQYIDFSQYQHFFDYMKPKRAKRIQEKIEEDVKAGRNPAYTNYVMPFRILEHERGFILLSDVYNPSSTFSQNYYSPYGNNPYYYDPYWGAFPYPRRMYNQPYGYPYRNNNTQANDNVKTYETFITSIDNQGKLKWDYSFPLDDVKLPAVEQTADFDLASNSVYFIYKKDHELKVKQIPLDGENPSEYTEEIKLEFSTDEVRSGTEREGNVRFWFGDSFYVWGIQNIRNNTKADKVRRVFYINRLVAH
jgi:hypothetical protein